MNNILRLQYISLCQKVTQELENHIGVRDKDLAEFIIDLAKDSSTLDQFKQNLVENDGDFPDSFIESIFKLIQKMLPKSKEKQKEQKQQEQLENQLKNFDKDLEDVGQNDINNENKQNKNEEIDLSGDDSEEEKIKKRERRQKLERNKIRFPGLSLGNDNNNILNEEIELDNINPTKKKNQDDDSDKLEFSDYEENEFQNNNNKSRSRSRDRKHKKSKKHYRSSRSRERSKKDKKSKKHHRSSKSHSPSKKKRELLQNEIYEGIVKTVQDFGCFVQIMGINERREGLVHITDIQQEKITNAFEVISRNQHVFVKVVLITQNKIKLSMKEVDQKTGKFIEKKGRLHYEQLENQQGSQQQQDSSNSALRPITYGENQYGSITGINIKVGDPEKQAKEKKKRKNSAEMWEDQRIQTWSKLGITDRQVNIDDSQSDEDEVNVELAAKEPTFLEGQTTKAGVILSPIRIVKNPEGSLNREALNAVQHAKDRRDIKEQQQRAIVEQMDKDQISKFWDDPNAETRALVGQLRNMGQGQDANMPDYKKETMFKAGKQVNKSLLSMKQQREQLPIFDYKKPLIKAIKDNRILIVIGETGSGKTTQMTQYMLEAGFAKHGKKIGCTQPRRVAATSVAKRVSEEMGVVLGEEIGYTIRFEDCTTKNTVLKYMTDGMLLREALIDPDMSQYSVIMLDEAHERNLHTDILFGLLKKVVSRRKDFTLIVTSATLDAQKFSEYFFDCKIFRIPGRTFQVDNMFSTEPEEDYLDAALIVVMQIHLHEPSGDILLFLTGQEEIDNACSTLYERMKKLGPDAPELIICPVYAALSSDVQNRIFAPAPEGARKVVIATNIAEASLTIDGIFYVIDPGFAKVKMFNPKLGMDTLQIAPISQASARQRSGRAGRTGPGKCYRLYTEAAFKNEMLPTSIPEIQRTNLANTVLLLKAMGINDLLNFDFMDPPPVQTLISALEQLYTLGCLDDDGLLTKLGMKMAEFPLEPPLGKMLLTSVDLECSDEICTIIAMISVQTVFMRPKDKQTVADQKRAKFSHPDGDHLTFLTVYEAWKHNNFSNIWCSENYIDARSIRRAQDVRKQLVGILDRYRLPVKSAGRNYAKIRKAIAAGFFFHAAKKDPQEGYKTIMDNHTVYIHPSSALFNRPQEWVIYHELILTSKEYMRNVTTIDPKWLIDVAPNFYQFSSNQSLNSRKKQEKLEPMAVKYGDANAWRLSRR